MTQLTDRPRQHAVDLGKIRSSRRREVAVGSLALLLTCGIVVGIPAALLVLFGWPLPSSIPTSDVLTEPLSFDIVLDAIACLVWLAWLHLVVCLFVEWRASHRGVGLTPRVPFAGASQDLARRLVGAVLLLSTASGAVSVTAVNATGPAPQRPAVVAPQQTGAAPVLVSEPVPSQATGSATSTQSAPGGTKIGAPPPARTPGQLVCTVMPPKGRYHDNLWDIAERHLGNGLRYKEIFALNQGRVFPDGRKLTEASLIHPGWRLIMPADAVGLAPAAPAVPGRPATAVTPSGSSATGTSSTASGQAERSVRENGAVAPGRGTRGDVLSPMNGGPAPQPRTALPTQPALPQNAPPRGNSFSSQAVPPRTVPPAGNAAATKAVGAADGSVPVTAIALWGLFGIGLLSYGVIEALGAKRRRQGQRRQAGEALPRPTASVAALEVALRTRADGESARFLDQALRAAAAEGDGLSQVYAARLTSYRLELLLSPGRTDAPAPFVAEDAGRVWAVAREAALPATDYTRAPMPGLVSVGAEGDASVLVDLEAADGVVCLDGPEPRCRALLAAAAAELATNVWSDHVRLTLVGFGEELVALAPDRVRWVDQVTDVLPELESRAPAATPALHDSDGDLDGDAVLTGRVRPSGGPDGTPDYVLLAQAPDGDSLRRLTVLASGRRGGVGVLIAGQIAGARWTFRVDEAGDLDTGPLGLRLRAAQLAEPAYSALAELLGSASCGEFDEGPDRFDVGTFSSDAPVDRHLRALAPPQRLAPEFPEDLEPDVPPVRLVRLLGTPDVFGGPDDDPPTPLLVEMVAYLAVNRDGVSPEALTAAIWPRGSRASEREAAMAQLSDWLGADEAGQPRLLLDEEGWLRLSAEVRLDWHQFAALAVRGQQSDLRRALELVRGPIIDGAPRGRYAWLGETALPYDAPALIADTAHELAGSYLSRGDAAGAANAARLGLRVDSGDEVLWRDLVRAEQAIGGIDAAREVARDMVATLQRIGGLDLVTAETSAVIRALLQPVAAQAAQDA